MFNDLHIEKINVKFGNYLLFVNKKSFQFGFQWRAWKIFVLSMVKYWVRLNDIKDIPLETISIKEEQAMSEKTQNIWLTCIKTILNEIGMSDSYLNFDKCTTKTIKNLQTKLR